MTVGSGFDVIDGGKGDDTVVFKGDASEWTQGEKWGNTIVTNNETGETTTLKNVEHVEYGGENATASTADTTSTYSYDVTLNAGLTDTDGSENLSNITVDNLPTGTMISDSDGNVIDANTDGTYTVAVDDNGDAAVTLSSENELNNTALNDIQASVTSTESNSGDTHTTMAHTTFDESTDSDNDTVDVDSNNLVVDTGTGDDTINIDASGLAAGAGNSSSGFMNFFGGSSDGGTLDLDGGNGFDTLVASDNHMNIDLSAISDKVSNIESINLNGGGNTLGDIKLEDVMSVTDDDNVLRVEGDNGDTIELNTQGKDAEWSLGDFKTDAETGTTYQEYTGGEGDSTVTIDVSTDIHVDNS